MPLTAGLHIGLDHQYFPCAVSIQNQLPNLTTIRLTDIPAAKLLLLMNLFLADKVYVGYYINTGTFYLIDANAVFHQNKIQNVILILFFISFLSAIPYRKNRSVIFFVRVGTLMKLVKEFGRSPS